MLTLYKYLSLLRSSELAPWNQQEISDLSALSFRFAEKRAPDHYAISITDYMTYPVPRNLLISGPRVIQPWDLTDPENGGEKEMRELLNLCTVERSRALYMGPQVEFDRVKGAIDWQTEKWYGTQYYVEKFSEDFLTEVRSLLGSVSVASLLINATRHQDQTMSRNCSSLVRTHSFPLISKLRSAKSMLYADFPIVGADVNDLMCRFYSQRSGHI